MSGKFTFKWFTGYKIHEDDVKGRRTRIDHNNSRFLTSIYLPIILEYIKYKNWYWSKNTYTKFVILTITGLVCQIRTAVMIFNWRGCPDVDTDVQVNIYQTLTRIAVFPKFSGYLFWRWISQAINNIIPKIKQQCTLVIGICTRYWCFLKQTHFGLYSKELNI